MITTHLTLNDIERRLFAVGATETLALLNRFEFELLDGTLSADEAKVIDAKLEAAIARADGLQQVVEQVVSALDAASYLRKAQAAALTAALRAALEDPPADYELEIDRACGLVE